MKIKKTLLFISTLACAQYLNAGSNTGIIKHYHLNIEVPNRGVCIQMTPKIQTTTEWACLPDVNSHLYSEATSLLLAAYAAKFTCSVTWNSEDDQFVHGKIIKVECQ